MRDLTPDMTPILLLELDPLQLKMGSSQVVTPPTTWIRGTYSIQDTILWSWNLISLRENLTIEDKYLLLKSGLTQSTAGKVFISCEKMFRKLIKTC